MKTSTVLDFPLYGDGEIMKSYVFTSTYSIAYARVRIA